jgi:hypothetical protein
MKFFPVVNLSRLGQGKAFETLSDLDLARICGAVNKFNEWKDWADTPTGDRYRRDAIADVQSIVSNVPRGIQPAAIQDIQNNCDGSADLIGFLNLNLPGTPPATPPPLSTPVATGDPSRTPPPTPPPPPNIYKPVASGAPGPGRRPPEVPANTGISEEDEMRQEFEDRTPVATPAHITKVQPVENVASQVSNPGETSEGLYNPSAPVASTDCSYLGPYAYFDGRQCQGGSKNVAPGSLVNQAMNLGPSGGGGGMVSPGNLDINPANLTTASFGGMGRGLGRRSFPVVNL